MDIVGTPGNDILTGTSGDDVLTGDGGSDTFVPTAGVDVITDFTVGADVIDLSGLGITSLAMLQQFLIQNGPDVVFSLVENGVLQTLTLQNVNIADLTAANFIFASPINLGGATNQTHGTAGDDNIVLTAPLNGGAIIDGGAGNDTLTLQNWATATFNPVNGRVTTSVNLLGTPPTSIERLDFNSQSGTSINALIFLNQAGGITQLVGGAGQDTLILLATSTGTYTIPTVVKTNWTDPTKSYLPASGDSVTLLGTGNANYTLNASAGHAGLEALVGGGGNDTLNGSDGMELLNGGGGVNVLHGGGGDDTLAINNTTPYSLVNGVVTPGTLVNGVLNPPVTTTFTGAGSTFDGGDGTDYLSVGGYVNFQGTLQSIEGIYLQSAYAASLANLNSQAAAVLEISGATLATLPANLALDGTGTIIVDLATGDTFNGSAYTFAGGSSVSFQINGSSADDTITGTSGGDTISGGAGNDTLIGGGGGDLFQLSLGNDVVTDFTVGTDKVDLQGIGISSFAQLAPYMSQVGNDVVLSLLYNGVVNTLTLQNVQMSDLHASDFNFASNSAPINDTGTDNADTLFGAGGNDTLSGMGGNDIIFSGGGADHLLGGDGDDTIVLNGVVSAAGTVIDGGTGTDTLKLTNASGPVVTGIYGLVTSVNLLSDTVTSIERFDFSASQSGMGLTALLGFGGGTPYVPLQIGASTELVGGAGNDSFVLVALAPAGGTFTMPSFTKTNWTDPTKAYLPGTGDVVYLIGAGNGNYTLNASVGHAGLEVLSGSGGNDTLNGSDGMELLNGGGGVNILHGGGGNDALAIVNNNSINGVITPGSVTTFTGAGSLFDGGDGTDYLSVGGYVNFQGTLQSIEGVYLQPAFTSSDNSQPSQAAAVLEISGTTLAQLPTNLALDGTGKIIVDLATGDTFDGSNYSFAAGSNVAFSINGSSAADTIIGTSGNDIINGGGGNDVLTGGAGADTFLPSFGQTTITDFTIGTDVIDVSGLGITSLAMIERFAIQSGPDTVFTVVENGVTNTLTLQNVNLVDLTAASFIFASPINLGGAANVSSGTSGDDDIVLTAPLNGGADINGGAGNDTLTLQNWALPASPDPLSPVFINSNGLTQTTVGLLGVPVSSIERLDFNSQTGTGLNTVLSLGGFFGNQVSGVSQLVGGAGQDALILLVADGPSTYTIPTFVETNWTPSAQSYRPTGDVVALVAVGSANYTLNVSDDGSGGHSGVEALISQDGNDILNGNNGMDILNGGGGVNQLYGGGGNDTLVIANTTPNNANNGVVTQGPTTTFTGAGSTFDGGSGTDYLSVGGYVNFQGTLVSIEGIYLQPAFSSTNVNAASQAAAVLEISGQTWAELPSNLALDGTGTIIVDLAHGDSFDSSQYTFAPGSNISFILNVTLAPGDTFNSANYTIAPGTNVSFNINGSSANDTIVGTSGNNTIYGGGGDDVLTGGAGADTFLPSSGHDVITDFTIGTDVIDLSGLGFTNLAMLERFTTQNGADAVITVVKGGATNTLTLQGINKADLTAASFIFASPINLGGATNVTSGTSGDDDIVLTAPLNAGANINGGAGNDTLTLQNWALPASQSNTSPVFVGQNGVQTTAGFIGVPVSSIERLDFNSQAGTGLSIILSFDGSGVFGNQVSGITQLVGGAGHDGLVLVAIKGIPGLPGFAAPGTNGGTFTIPTFVETNWTASALSYKSTDASDDYVVLVVSSAANFTLNVSDNGTGSHNGIELLSGGAGNDILNGNNGMDVLNGGGGVNQLHAGGGNDTLVIANTTPNINNNGVVTQGPTTTFTGAGSMFDGGDGTDFLSVGGYVNFQGTLVSIEGIYLQPAFSSTNANTASQAAAVLEISGQTWAELPANLALDGTGTIIVDLAPGDSFNSSQFVFAPGSNITFQFKITLAPGETFNNANYVFPAGASVSFIPSAGQDAITNFVIGTDKIDLRGIGITSFAMLQQYFLSQNGSDAVISVVENGVTNTLTLQGINEADLTASSFIFASGATPVNVTGSNNGDTIFGLGGNDVLTGGASSDLVFSGGGTDVIHAGGGDDTIVLNGPITGGATVDGGAGTDTLVLQNAPTATFNGPVGPTTLVNFAGQNFSSIEHVDFQSQSGTSLTLLLSYGGVLPNQAGGITQLVGGAGQDVFLLAAFGSGTYTLPTFTEVNWTAAAKPYLNGSDVVALIGIGNFGGGIQNYTLYSSSDNGLNDGSGNHVGVEALIGQDGNDNLYGDMGVDILNGGGGVNQLHAGGGNDVLVIANTTPNVYPTDPLGHPLPGAPFIRGVTTTFTGAGSTFDGGAGTDYLSVGGYVNFQGTLVSIEGIYLQPAFTSDNTVNASQAAAVLEMSSQTWAELPSNLALDGTGTIIVDLAAGDSFDSSQFVFAPGSNVAIILNVTLAPGDTFNSANYTIAPGTNVTVHVNGSSANDTIVGTSGNDTLNGGGGNDVLTGGAGADTFVPSPGQSVITDFTIGADVIDLSKLGVTSFATLQQLLTQNGSDAVITLVENGVTNTLTLQGINESNLTAANFIFAGGTAPVNVTGSDNGDTIFGQGGNDVLNGGASGDLIFSGGGTDQIHAGGGDDTIVLNGPISATGSVIDGGAGTDTLKLTNAAAPAVDSPYGPLTSVNLLSDTVTSIEKLDFSASQSGTVVQAVLWAGGAIPSQVATTTELIGGAGYDSVALVVYAPAGGTFTMPSFTKTNWTDATAAYLPGDSIYLVGAGPFNYTLNASASHTGVEYLVGSGGNDTLNGSDGMEYLDGGGGVNQLYGGGGNDALAIINNNSINGVITPGAVTTFTGAGSTFDGGSGTDYLVVGGYVNFQGTLVSIEGIDLRAAFTSSDNSQPSVAAAVLEISGAKFAALPSNLALDGTGTIIVDLATGDTFNGSAYSFAAGSNVSFTINGTSADDTIVGTSGNDTINGGAGNDIVQFSGLHSDFTVSQAADGSLQFYSASTGHDTITNVEVFRFADGDYAWDGTSLVQSNSGTASDGYLAGALIFIDVNGNGKFDPGEPNTVSDATGHFTLNSSAAGKIIAVGGTNIDTGLPNTLTLTAVSGSTQINPLTTVVQTLVDKGVSQADAESQVKSALGLDPGIDLSNYDILGQPAGDPNALAAQQAAAAVVVVLGTVVQNASGNDPAAAQQAGLKSLAAAVTGAAGGTVDLTDPGTLTTVLSTALPDASPATVDALVTTTHTVTTQIAGTTDLAGVAAVQQANGPTDVPVVAAALISSAAEGDPSYALDLLSGASDPLPTDVLNLSAVTYVVDGGAPSGTAPAGVSLSGSTLTVDPTNAAFNHLAVGQHSMIVVSYTVDNGHGGAVVQSETITITGTNDTPVVAAALTSSASRGTSSYTLDLLSGASDPDSGDTLSVTGVTYAVDGGSASGTAPAGVSLVGSTLTVDPTDAAFNSLAVGQHSTIVVSYTVSDGHGGTVAQTETVTITNDAPAVAAPLSSSAAEGVASYTLDLLSGATEVNAGYTLSVTGVTYAVNGGAPGVTAPAGVSLVGSTLSVDPTDGAFDHLAVGQHSTIVVSYTIDNGHGGTVAQTETVTITGTNDAPVVASALTSTAAEGAASYTLNLLSGASDPDSGDTLSVTGVTYVVDGGAATGTAPAGVSLVGSTLTVDPTNAVFNHLALGQHSTIVVSYTVSDGHGGTVAQTETVTITGTNDTPTVSAALTSTAAEGASSYTLDLLGGASDPDSGDTLSVTGVSYTVDGGAASSTAPAGVSLVGSTLTVDPTNAVFNSLAVGQHSTIVVSYTVSDGHGGSVAQTETVTITGTNDAPVVAAALTSTAAEGAASYTLDLLSGASDPDSGDTLSVTGVSYTVDGVAAVGTPSGVSLSGSTLTVDPTNAVFNHLAVGQHSTIVVSYTVSDGHGGTVAQTETVTITGTNDAPTVSAALTSTAAEGAASYTLDLLSGASDPDTGDTLSVTGVTYAVDGGAATGTAPAGVSLVGSTLTVDPTNAAFNHLAVGQHSTIVVSYAVSDGNGGTVAQTETVTITGTNDAPVVAAALTSSAAKGASSYALDLLAGASDPDSGDTLSVTGVTYAVDGDAATGTAPAGVSLSGNTLTVDPTNAVFNSLALGQHSTIVVSYTVSDGHGGTVAQTETITVTGTNHAPVVSAALTSTATEGAASYTLNLLSGASDPDSGDTLSVTGVTYSVDGGAASGTAPAGVSLSGSTLTVDPTNAAFNHLAVGQHSTIVVSYTVSDGHGGTVAQTETITINGTNDAPVVSAALTSTAAEGAASYTLNLLSGASDPDSGDTLSVTGITYAVNGGSASGTAPAGVSLSGSTLTVDPTNAVFNSLAVGQHSTIVVKYTISDGHGGTVAQTETITINGTNDAPVVSGPLTSTKAEGAASYTLNLLSGASDPDSGDTLSVTGVTYSVDGGAASGTAPAGVSLSGSTLTVDPTNAAFNHLAVGQHSTIVVSYTVSDGHGGTVAQTETITINGTNDAPVVSAALTSTAAEGAASYTLNLLSGASDPDSGDTLSVTGITYAVNGGSASGTAPAGVSLSGSTLTVDPTNAVFNSLAVGQHSTIVVKYTISDGHGGTVAQTETITINGTNDAPVAIAHNGFTTDNWTPLTISKATLLAGDTDPDSGDTLQVTSVQGAVGGTVKINDGNVIFTPDGTNIGPASFTYTISDGHGGTSTAAVSLTTTLHQITGTSGNDTLSGGSKSAQINGLAGNDTIKAGSAGDLITGGAGNDTLTGGAGIDTFIYHAGFGNDTISSFTATGASHDYLQVDKTMFSDWAHLLGATKQVGSDLLITLDNTDKITLKNVSLASFTSSDVHFV